MTAILCDILPGMSISNTKVNNNKCEEISFDSNESDSENHLKEQILAVEWSSGIQPYRFKLECSSSKENGASSDQSSMKPS